TPTASSPAPSAATATSRREDLRSQGRCRDVHNPKVVPATCRHDGGASAVSVSGSAGAGASRMPRSGTVTPGVCIFCQAGSHQSSGRQVSTGIGPVGPLYPILLPSPAGHPHRHFWHSRVHPLSLDTEERNITSHPRRPSAPAPPVLV